MRVLVIANRADPETGYVGEALAARGAVFDEAWREDDGVPLPSIGSHDLVLSLGSEWSVYWADRSEAVEREAAHLRGSVEAGVPVLGICFGAQVLAHALGGSVEPAPTGGEVGWHVVDTDVPELIPSGPYLQWHSDRFHLPPGAVELARSPVGPQAFRLGSALAVQFHPETTPEVSARWAADDRQHLERLGLDEDELARRSAAEATGARERAAVLVDGFLAGFAGSGPR